MKDMLPPVPTKYAMLLRILDTIRESARGTRWEAKYAVDSLNIEDVQQARARAFSHLYLKVMFGISDFSERESLVTDGPQDGGIDGYFIDKEAKRIYLLQSKFRNTERNFEQKEIDPTEILAMDIDRITRGNTTNDDGISYNGKIQGLIRRISEISDIARYNYHVAIIANCTLPTAHLRKLTDGFPATVFNFERAYGELVFPIVSGTFFRAEDVTIQLDLNNKSGGAKTNYSVETPDYTCEITVLFVPTLEIAKAMDRYRNSILEYNPRSYLDLQEGKQVHAAIRETLLRPSSNEFALMNNGITILSDETNLSERIGVQNKAQLRLLRPQIINGGQTAYTLSRIYEEDKANSEDRFAGKEVLAKVITLTPKDSTKNTEVERLRLIDEISTASNKQAPVVAADRVSNETMYINLQRMMFERYGILYERKRGEFSDGINDGYVDKKQILERNLFLRIFLSVRGNINLARRKRIFLKHKIPEADLSNLDALDLFADGYGLFQALIPASYNGYQARYRNLLAKVFIGVGLTERNSTFTERAGAIEKLWSKLIGQAANLRRNFTENLVDSLVGPSSRVFSHEKWVASDQFEIDLREFVRNGSLKPHAAAVEKDVALLAEFREILDETFPDKESKTET